MRTREEIEKTQHLFPESPAVLSNLSLEVLLDIRDNINKLVEKKERTKLISTEVNLNDKEQALLDSIEA